MNAIEKKPVSPMPVKTKRRCNFFHTSMGGVVASELTGLEPEKIRSGAWVAGTDAPEIKEVRVGFIALTDCAPIAVAAELGFDRKYGIRIVPSREASWAAIRDKTLSGDLHAAQMLYGLVYGVQMGIGGQQRDMSVLMTLNQNGQAITLSKQLEEKGVRDGQGLKQLIGNESRGYTFAQTFPTGTHAMWLYYWLASHGIDPFLDARTIVLPPPQMVSGLRLGSMDGFCAGEPWNASAIHEKMGFTVATSQDIWADHPEKVLATTADFAAEHPNTTLALTKAVLDACRYIDASANRLSVVKLIAGKSYVSTPAEIIAGRFLGNYEDGTGKKWQDPNHVKFFNDGQVNFPYLSDGMWFLTQHKRWGLLTNHPDYRAIAAKVNRIDIYTEAAKALGISVPHDPMRISKLLDGVIWDGKDPKAYADTFIIKAKQ